MESHQQTFTVSITVDNPAAALDYYQKGFNAELISKFELPGGDIMHADIKIGNSFLFLSGEFPEWKAFSPKTVGGSPNLLCIETEECDGMFDKAVELGGEAIAPMQDFPWGVRAGVLVDPFGYRWHVGKKVEEVSSEELMKRLSSMQECDN